jgi:hypothetical protein
VQVQLAGGAAMAPRTEYILTSSAAAYDEFKARLAAGALATAAAPLPIPASIQSAVSYLNGAALAVDGTGMLPVYPLPGSVVSTPSSPAIMPAYTFGFFVLDGAGPVAACQS